jgi:hypothetical protein
VPRLLVSFIFTLAFLPTMAGAADSPAPQFIEYKPQRYDPHQDFFGDILSHLRPEDGNHYAVQDPIVYAHEATHGINANLRNSYRVGAAFYVGNNKAALMAQPRCRLSHVAQMIPPALRKDGYQTYFVEMRRHWDDSPLYVVEEWDAYTNDSTVALTTHQIGKRNDVHKLLEFSVYAVYAVGAAQHYDPSYDCRPLISFVGWNEDRAMALYRAGQQSPTWNWDNGQYLRFVQTSPAAADLRRFCVRTWGAEWSRRVFGFEGER